MKKIISLLFFACLMSTGFGLSTITQAFDIGSFCDNKCLKTFTSECGEEGCTQEQSQKCSQECQKEYQECVSGNGNDQKAQEYCQCVTQGGIKLNTDFPFIGRCIEKSSDGKAITGIAKVFTDILMTLIITLGFGMVIRGGVQFAMNKPAEGRKTIMNVVIAFAALGSLGIILRLINPNFFK